MRHASAAWAARVCPGTLSGVCSARPLLLRGTGTGSGMAEPGDGDKEEAAPGPGDKEEAAPAPKKRRLAAGERYVPPPRKLSTGVSFGAEHFAETSYYFEGGLRKVRPYYYDFRTYCKGRWVGRSLLHVFSTEFRSQPLSYYRAAASAGRLRLNEEPVRDLDIVLKNNDYLRNTVHRHEPPVTARPLRILAEDEELVVVDKPSSLPVHPCGRFRHNTVIFILGKEHGLRELHPVHRLDRMTSGVLLFAKSARRSQSIDRQARDRQLEKEYVCRVVGEFPEHQVVCEEPILVVSYKVGVCRVDPRGKSCKTIFQRLSYNGRSSVVRCLPRTGRTHQIRVHLQYLGHPILNDPVYNARAWGPSRGKGGAVGLSDAELLEALLEEHRAKESLGLLGVAEEDLACGAQEKLCWDQSDCAESAPVGPAGEGSSPAQGARDPQRDAQDPERGTWGPERGAQDPQNGTLGPQTDAQDPERDAQDPQNGTWGPERGAQDPQRDTRGPERGAQDPERNTWGPERDAQNPQRGAQDLQRDTWGPERDAQDPQRDTKEPERDTKSPKRDAEDPERDAQDLERGTCGLKRDAEDPKRDAEDPEGNSTAARPLNSSANLERLGKDQEPGLSEKQDGQTAAGSEEKDPLCLECRITRRDPSPQELVMYLHALRYKGEGFEYCSEMPEWAREDWQE